MSLFNEKGVKAFEVGPLDETQVASTRPETVPVKFQVSLNGLAPGHYNCQINVVDRSRPEIRVPARASGGRALKVVTR